MQVIENLKVKEKLYVEKLKNGLTVMIIPKKGMKKKYIIWGTNYGSNESKFIVPGETEVTAVPDGVAHFLEHKMFEQENGRNSLDVLTELGVEANAYTTNDHTAYLFSCTENFYPALDELMDYVQHPYFTDENVEKEKGIIGQEIMMYDDYPDWKVYLNALKAMYSEFPIRIDITGTIETISHINKEVLYKCYNTFYNPSNMAMVICGDFEPNDVLEEVKKRLLDIKANGEIKRIYPEEPEEIVKSYVEEEMEVSRPLYTIGIKDVPFGKCKNNENGKSEKDSQIMQGVVDIGKDEIVRKHIVIEILLNLIFGESSTLYKELYNQGIILASPSMDYEFGRGYAHILYSGQSKDPEKLYDEFKKAVKNMKENGIPESDFERIRKTLYGDYVKEYNDVTDIARMFLADYFKGINSFDYLEQIGSIHKNYAEQILNEVFDEDKMVLSVIKGK